MSTLTLEAKLAIGRGDTRGTAFPMRLRPAVARIGFWSAAFVAFTTIWFAVAFGLYAPSLPVTWPGIEAFAAAFQPLPYVAWVLPCLLLALCFPVMFLAIHFAAPEARQIWSGLGTMFAAMYGAVLGATYFLLLTVVRASLETGDTQGLSWLVIGFPHSVTNTLEGAGYGLMGLAMLFVAPAFAGSRMANWVRGLFFLNGAVTVLSLPSAMFGFIAGTWVALAIWCVTFPAAVVLVALLFYRSGRIARVDVELTRGSREGAA